MRCLWKLLWVFYTQVATPAGQRSTRGYPHIAQHSYNCYRCHIPEGRNFSWNFSKSPRPSPEGILCASEGILRYSGGHPGGRPCAILLQSDGWKDGWGPRSWCRIEDPVQAGRPGHSKGLEVQEVWKGIWIDLILANLMPTADGWPGKGWRFTFTSSTKKESWCFYWLSVQHKDKVSTEQKIFQTARWVKSLPKPHPPTRPALLTIRLLIRPGETKEATTRKLPLLSVYRLIKLKGNQRTTAKNCCFIKIKFILSVCLEPTDGKEAPARDQLLSSLTFCLRRWNPSKTFLLLDKCFYFLKTILKQGFV